MKLSDLNDGDRGTVLAMNGLSNEVRKKLMVMGLLPNTEVKLIRRAPMGDPLQVEVRGIALAVRESIASSIEVEKA
ncbi:FeoA family protein [Vibrio ziniensis]|uniref:Ferrous iron transport protein A n=1 Tax=Vibrio ziniensis TaxID=2711221 RepID=A0A6G7CJW7_9VIBR|nr:FeoA family protein [Vibrio ziniensis]QIH42374.1 ferrous iron transport protein A [Vibrio ziniensis]